MTMRLRVYCETLPYEEVTRPRTLGLLGTRELGIVLAVRPWHLGDLPRVARVLGDAGVALAVWPMLADDEGRWASVANAAAFARLALRTADVLTDAGAPFGELLFDLEPPFSLAAALAHGPGRLAGAARRGALRTATRRVFAQAEDELALAVRALHARGVGTSAAVWPLVALDPRGGEPWQRALGTPVDRLGIQRVSVMAYTSILEGWSRGALRRPHATALLAAASRRTARRWGARGGISVGCVGTGAFEDEPIYRSPAELAEDVAVARAEGSEDLSLFDLGGVLARPPAEAWLDAFVHARSEGSPGARPSRRVAAARVLARAATWALARRR
jgi:hypothetical protein